MSEITATGKRQPEKWATNKRQEREKGNKLKNRRMRYDTIRDALKLRPYGAIQICLLLLLLLLLLLCYFNVRSKADITEHYLLH